MLDAKVQSSTFRKMSNLGLSHNLVALNINLQSRMNLLKYCNLQKIHITRGPDRVRNENVVPQKIVGQNVTNQLTKLSKIGFSVE